MATKREERPAIAISMERKVNLGNYETATVYVGISDIRSVDDVEYAFEFLDNQFDGIQEELKRRLDMAAGSLGSGGTSFKRSTYKPAKATKVHPTIIELMKENGVLDDAEWKGVALRAMEKEAPVAYFKGALKRKGLKTVIEEPLPKDADDPFAED